MTRESSLIKMAKKTKMKDEQKYAIKKSFMALIRGIKKGEK